MNPPTFNPALERKRPTGVRLGWQVAGIFAGAVLLGTIYNNASPLGVRASSPAETDELKTPASTLPPKPAKARKGYVNETLSLSLEESGGAHTPALAAPAAPSPAAINSLTWPQVKPLLDAGRIVLVDARAKTSFDVGHIPGAVSLPVGSPAPEIQAFAGKYPKHSTIIVYCASTACHLSRQLAETLIRTGSFTDVSEMPGGYAEYLAAQSAPAQTKP